MANGNEICRMDAVTLAGKVRAKELSPVEVIEASIERMGKLEPLLHAFCTPGPDLARAAAKQLEADIMAGKDPGPLAGVPIGVKDLICTKDLPTVSGSFAYKDFNGGVDDVVVERLRAAGAIVTGKTNVPEFGYSGAGHNPVFETSRNPWDLERNPGGSSAGAGAAVAAHGEPVFVPALAENRFMPDFAGLDEAMLSRTAAAFVCTPANPQGTAASLDYLCAAIELARAPSGARSRVL